LRVAATARPYALLGVLGAAAVAGHLAAGQVVDSERKPRVWLLLPTLAAVHLAGLFTQPLYAFFAGACAVASLGLLPGRRGVMLAAVPCAAVALYLASWWPMLSATFLLPTTSWMTKPGATDLIAGYLALWGWRNGWVLAGVILALLLVRRGALKEVSSPAWRFCLVVSVLVMAGTFGASLIAKPVYSAASTPIVILPALSVAIAVTLVRLGSPPLALAVSILLFASAAAYATEGWRPDPAPSAASVAAVAREVRCGDRVVAAGVSFAPVTWYARKTDFPACVPIEAFPAEMRAHPGWFDAASPASRRVELLGEAAAVVASLGPDGRVWVFAADRGAGSDATSLLDDVGGLTLERRLPLAGTYFDHVRVYRSVKRE
jgi:hypothetical protein